MRLSYTRGADTRACRRGSHQVTDPQAHCGSPYRRHVSRDVPIKTRRPRRSSLMSSLSTASRCRVYTAPAIESIRLGRALQTSRAVRCCVSLLCLKNIVFRVSTGDTHQDSAFTDSLLVHDHALLPGMKIATTRADAGRVPGWDPASHVVISQPTQPADAPASRSYRALQDVESERRDDGAVVRALEVREVLDIDERTRGEQVGGEQKVVQP